MESRIIKSDFSGLTTFLKGISENHVINVGIFGNKTGRQKTEHRMVKGKMRSFKSKEESTQTNAEIGALHEFGSFTKHIPARSFLRLPLHQKQKEIVAEASQGAAALLAKGQVVLVLKRLGIACENWIQRAFETRGFGAWKANAPSTIRRKGSSQPLIDTAQLRRSIASKVV